MNLRPEPPVSSDLISGDSLVVIGDVDAGGRLWPRTALPRLDFVEVFQQIINGLSEQIALVDKDWSILAVNPAWIRTAAIYGYDSLTPGTNYLEFCKARADEGHSPAGIAVNGIEEMERLGEPTFSYVYHGRDRWEGHAFQLCISKLEIGGQVFATVTRYDVSELVHLRQMREDFSHSLIEHQATERRRMAREIHDSTMQLLTGVGLSLGQLKQTRQPKASGNIVEEMEQLLGEAQRELGAISFLAHAPMVSELGLATALRQLVGGFGRRTGLKIAISAEAEVSLPPSTEVAIYRLVQEALSNVHRHARATDVAVGLYQRKSILHVAIADNGAGMPEGTRRGVGLSSMRDRIAELGGRLMLRAGKPGTILIASVPTDAEIRPVRGLAFAV
jgi:two-component system NarL family sensor kinase